MPGAYDISRTFEVVFIDPGLVKRGGYKEFRSLVPLLDSDSG